MQPVVEQRGYAGTRTSPFGIGATIAVHAAALGVFLLMPKEMIDVIKTKVIETYPVPIDPPPPEQSQPKTEAKPLQKPIVDKPSTRDPIIPDMSGNILDGQKDIIFRP